MKNKIKARLRSLQNPSPLKERSMSEIIDDIKEARQERIKKGISTKYNTKEYRRSYNKEVNL